MIHRFQQQAMATEFEVIIAQEGCGELYAAQASEAVFAEIARLEDDLSRFRHTSDIWRLGRLSAGESMTVSLAAFDCLALAKATHAATGGAFDITVGPLMEAVRARQTARVEEVRQHVGSHLFELDETELRVTVHASGMIFDLGAVGKGYALDQAAVLLRDWEIENAFLNAGDSTLLALGRPPGEAAWTVTLADGVRAMDLTNRALSGSGFAVQGAHIIDPRTLHAVPVRRARTYALAPTAALSDALSTAFMVMTPEERAALCAEYPDIEALEIEERIDTAEPEAQL